MNRLAHRGWKRRFDEPIPLPRGRYLVTLEDAGNYITRLAKAEHEAKRTDVKCFTSHTHLRCEAERDRLRRQVG
jgi:hypothetical protein